MDVFYLVAVKAAVTNRQPIAEKQTVEDYLATFADLPPQLRKSKKCAIKADSIRNRGNEAFQLGNYEDAALLYTCSILHAPPYSKSGALAYANRSAALYHLKSYEECVSDINRALDLPYPDDLKMKIISRKESAVGNISNARNGANKNKPVDDLKFPHGKNAKIPDASRGIDIAYSSQDGRKLVATMPFQAGDVLVFEDPFLPVVFPQDELAGCHHCLKQCLCLIPCDRCICQVYCSEKCRTEAYESYHRIECEIQSTLISTSCLHVLSLMFHLKLLVTLSEQGTNLDAVYDDFKEIEQSSNPAELGFTGEQFLGNKRKALISSSFGKKIEHDPAILFEVGYVVTLLKNFTNFFKTNADIPIVANLLVKLHFSYRSSAHQILYFKSEEKKGFASYPLIHLANHACSPNTITYHDTKNRLVIRAFKTIKPGDQILSAHKVSRYAFIEICTNIGYFHQCSIFCKLCKKSITHTVAKSLIKIDRKLRVILRKNHYDIGGLWKLLDIVHRKHEPHVIQVEVIRRLLTIAYQGCCDSVNVDVNLALRILGIQ